MKKLIRFRRQCWLFLKYVGGPDYPDDYFRMTPARTWQGAGLILDMAESITRMRREAAKEGMCILM